MFEIHLFGEIPTKCNSCGMIVKAGDVTCQYCGVANPGMGMGKRGRLFLWMLVTLVAAYAAYSFLAS